MPRFTLTKHPDYEDDSTISVTFNTEFVDTARAACDDFLKASGFESPAFEFPIDWATQSSHLPPRNKWMWDDQAPAIDREYYECSEDPIQPKSPKFKIVE